MYFIYEIKSFNHFFTPPTSAFVYYSNVFCITQCVLCILLKICRLWQTFPLIKSDILSMLLTGTWMSDHITFHLPPRTWTPTWHSVWLAALRTELALGYLSILMFIRERTLLHILMYAADDRNLGWCLRLQCFNRIFVSIHVANWCNSWGNTFLNGQDGDAGVGK